MALADIPFYGAYTQRTAQNQAAPVQQLQQVGAVLGLQKALQEQEQAKQATARRESYRQELTGLGPNPTQEQLAGVAAKYVDDPSKLMEVQQKSLDRQEAAANRAFQFAQTVDLRQQALDQQKAAFDQRTQDAQARAEFDKWYKGQSLVLRQQNDAANGELKRLGFEIQRQGQQLQLARLDLQRDANRNQQVAALGTALERANLPEADTVLRGVEEALKETPQIADYISGPKSIAPDMVLPKEITAGRQAFQKLFNITLKNRSGAAVTIPEFERLKSEFASGVWKKPEQLVEGVKQARKIITDHYRSVAAGYGPDTLKAYNENLRQSGGSPILEVDASSPAPAPAPTPASSARRLRFDAQGNPVQ